MWKIGMKTRVVCKNCKELQYATTQKRPIKVQGQILRDILVGVCDRCDKIATVQQVLPL